MTTAIIDQAVRALCVEVETLDLQRANWRALAEEELLFEAAVCIFSSQVKFEVAVAAANRIRRNGLLRPRPLLITSSCYEARVVSVLSKPLHVYFAGRRRDVQLRFKNRFASFLAVTIKKIYGCGTSFVSILSISRSAQIAREYLVASVAGFGPKQASLYLRRVGFSCDLAILDRHILDYLKLARAIDPKPGSLSKLSTYEQIEREFQEVAGNFGHAVGCVDVAMWVTMRVAKREALL